MISTWPAGPTLNGIQCFSNSLTAFRPISVPSLSNASSKRRAFARSPRNLAGPKALHEPELRLHEPELRLHEPELRLHEPELRLHELELRLHELELRLHELELRLHELELRLHELELRLHELEALLNGFSAGHLRQLRTCR